MKRAVFGASAGGCPCCFIIPPQILQRLATSGDPHLAETAGRTLRLTDSILAFRAQLSTGAPSPTALKREGLRRQVFDCKGFTDLPGDIARSEADPDCPDKAANEAFANAGITWNFFKEIFNRESVDGNGKTLVSSVHYGQKYDNAFWDGRQMVYGDGDGIIFERFTAALDVIAHELTHGVTQYTAQLPYQDEPGALNESMSDVFGSMVKQWSLGQTVAEADWLIGAGILAPSFKGKALRDLANPGTAYNDTHFGKDPQPGHMKDYVHTEADHGGVHTNSGIPNRAFVLAAKAIGGKSWEKTGRVWYVTLTQRLTASAGFAKCATETISVARDLFPDDPDIAAKIAQAWSDVGVLEEAPTAAGLAKVAGAYVVPLPPVRPVFARSPMAKKPRTAKKTAKKKKTVSSKPAAKPSRGTPTKSAPPKKKGKGKRP
ncbi:peptidase M4 family protein [Beijerinckiaceae bacterium]|nr:peptidase M4 family protein [Beijerinckiaceae bacterium]